MSFTNVMIVGLGGFLGSVARFLAVRSIDGRLNSAFPYGTLSVNLIGSFILDLLTHTSPGRRETISGRCFLGPGFAVALQHFRPLPGKISI